VSNDDDGSVVSDQQQKIFPIGGGTVRYAAYCVSGHVVVASRDGTSGFHFDREMSRATQTFSIHKSKSLFDYARKIGASVHRALKEAHDSGKFDFPQVETVVNPSEPGSTIARVLIDGYHKGVP
jgi:hypothetical protein